MSEITLFGNGQTRAILPEGLVKALKLDVKVEPKDSPAHVKNFPLKKVPALTGPHGFKLHEVIAITYYLVKLNEENSALLGKTTKEQSEVLMYMSFATSDFMAAVTTVIASILGRTSYNKKGVEQGIKDVDTYVANIEKRLVNYTYLVGERLTVADLFFASCFYRPLTLWCGTKWRSEHPAFMRWFNTVSKTEFLSFFFDELKLADEPVLHPPKKEKKKGEKGEKKQKQKQQQPKKEKKKEEAKPAAEQPKKKPEHPLKALGNTVIPIDQWKRVYSNEDTRTGSLPYFWKEFYNPEEWSLYKVGYKYNDELTLTFMSNNLIGGFFARLTASEKYLFGCLVVYGENNNNGIVGAFLVRGQDYKPAFDVAPDWESYEFTKLDASKEEDKDFINNMWAWDQPVIVNGEKREIADGKVFK